MLSAVLRSDTAVKLSIQIMQAFVEMKKFISINAGIFQRLDKVEQKQIETDQKFPDGKIPCYGNGGSMRYVDKHLYDKESILIPRKGSLNNIMYQSKPFWTVDTMFWSKIDVEKIFPKFLFYQLTLIDYTVLNVGSAVPSLTVPVINENLPPLPEQKAIAEVLSSLDDKIDLLHRQNKTLEQMAETLFRQWFLPVRDRTQTGIEEAKDDWEERPLSFFGDLVCGKTPSKKKHEYFGGPIPFIKIPDMHNKVFIFETDDTLTDEGKDSQQNKTLPPKTICVSCIATVGLVILTTVECQTNQQINSIIPRKDEYRYYLYLQMKSSYDLLHAMASGGTATLNLNTGNFSKIEVLLPEEEELKEFHNKVEPIFDKIYKNEQQIRTLEKMRDTLLPKLMSGEIKVKCDDERKIPK